MNESLKCNPPQKEVVYEFGVDANVTLLPGGEGQSYRAAEIVLKPAQDIEQTNWIADTLSSISEEGFRVNQPVKTVSGEWIFEGWQAFQYINGEHVKGRWKEKIAVSRKFHNALSKISRPDFIGKRMIPWEIADKVVWNTEPEGHLEQIRPVTDRLLTIKKHISPTEQIIHGDMTGNILFEEPLPPAIIDFSPYWRPAEYATAIIIVDAVVWEEADDTVFSELENTFENNQLLIRAALWRIKTAEEFSKKFQRDLVQEANKYTHFIDKLLERINDEAT
jgi:uncharacterized protein (TIGR02569 family)